MPKEKNTHKSKEQNNYLQKFTVAVFGDSGVGKTSLINRLVGMKFNPEHLPTIEDFHVKHLAFKNKTCELQIIDTSGTYEFPAMRRVDMEKADALVVVYSMDRPDSFRKLERYMEEIRESRNNSKRDCVKPVVVVSNKTDLPNLTEPKFIDKRGLNISVGLHLNEKYGCHWLDASAKSGDNVQEAFYKVLEYLVTSCSKEKNNSSGKKIEFLITKKNQGFSMRIFVLLCILLCTPRPCIEHLILHA